MRTSKGPSLFAWCTSLKRRRIGEIVFKQPRYPDSRDNSKAVDMNHSLNEMSQKR